MTIKEFVARFRFLFHKIRKIRTHQLHQSKEVYIQITKELCLKKLSCSCGKIFYQVKKL